MTTKRSKRWNGDLDSLSPDFLKEVLEKMQSYGDRVQFELPTKKAARPSYQVINPTNRKMAFDDRHLILRLNENGDVGDQLTTIYSMDTIKAAMLNNGKPARGTRTSRSGTTRRVASAGDAIDADTDLTDLERLTGVSLRRSVAPPPVADVDTIEREKYAYYKANRDAFPDGITKYSQDISALMRAGVSAEDAFEQVIKENFQF